VTRREVMAIDFQLKDICEEDRQNYSSTNLQKEEEK
jgi:hypothetical protein